MKSFQVHFSHKARFNLVYKPFCRLSIHCHEKGVGVVNLNVVGFASLKSKLVSEENVPRVTGEEQPNRFSRRSLKFAVCVIVFVYIPSDIKCTRRNIAIGRVYIPLRKNV